MMTRSRVRGVVLGTAIGDALGMPVEGLSHQNIRTYYRGIKGFRADEKRGDLEAGQWTDDTQTTVALLEVLLEAPTPEAAAEALARKYVALLPQARRWGTTSREAVERLQAGVSWQASGGFRPTNGAAMRAAALGLWWALTGAREEEARTWIRTLLGITHRHPEALVAGYGQVRGIRQVLQTPAETFDGGVWLEHLTEAVEQVEVAWGETGRACSRQLRGLQPYLHEIPLDLRDRCGGITSRASSSWPFAAAMFARRPHLVEATLLSAINAGGDADTVGAMVGALLGALHGVEGFPRPWVEEVEQGAALQALADRAWDVLRTPR